MSFWILVLFLRRFFLRPFWFVSSSDISIIDEVLVYLDRFFLDITSSFDDSSLTSKLFIIEIPLKIVFNLLRLCLLSTSASDKDEPVARLCSVKALARLLVTREFVSRVPFSCVIFVCCVAIVCCCWMFVFNCFKLVSLTSLASDLYFLLGTSLLLVFSSVVFKLSTERFWFCFPTPFPMLLIVLLDLFSFSKFLSVTTYVLLPSSSSSIL